MKAAVVLLGLALLLDASFSAEESCLQRCGTFDPQRKCQCDPMCVYYTSCCADYDTVCSKKLARGDTFDEAEDLPASITLINTTTITPTFTVALTTPASPAPTSTQRPTPPVDPNAAPCSGRRFDAFLQMKNGSIYAFRGEYVFELDDKSVLPGYPKLIEEVWGIPGPIDAAFTRINCQGKSYIFKGNQYWRFEGNVMDDDYPREISVGFDGIPDSLDAAFAVPAPSHRGKEKAYFFKDDKYYHYEFKQQPSHEECVDMSRSSPSVLFTRYTELFCDQTWEDVFSDLFMDPFFSHHTGTRYTSRDWVGIRPPVDAAMVGRVYLSPKPTSSPPSRRKGRRKRPSRRRGHRGRHSRHTLFDDLFGYDDWFDYSDYSDMEEIRMPEQKGTPVQNVYFFKGDKYYRVNLRTKRVDSTIPPYPRSIAKYWLGCTQEGTSDASRAEKK